MNVIEMLSAQAAALRSAAYEPIPALVRDIYTPMPYSAVERHARRTSRLQYGIRYLTESLRAFVAARVHRNKIYMHAGADGPSWQAELGARIRVERRWSDVMSDLSDYILDIADADQGIQDGDVNPAADGAIGRSGQIIADVLRMAPRPDEVRIGYDTGVDAIIKVPGRLPECVGFWPYPVPHEEAGFDFGPGSGFGFGETLPDRISDGPDPAGLLADVKPAPAVLPATWPSRCTVVRRGERLCLIDDAGCVIADDTEVPF